MHCKNVSVRDVDFDLTESAIRERMSDWIAYTKCEYLILSGASGFASLRVHKEEGPELFKKVTGFEIISLPEETDYVEDPDVDVLNIPTLARVQMEHPGKAVVLKGMFSHIVLIKDIRPLFLEVVDSVPPSPSKLGVLVGKALDSGFVPLPIIVRENAIDMRSKIPEVNTEAVMFPCKVSGIVADIPTYYLDGNPELEHDVTLVGCNLSKRIFESLYRKKVPFINVCPVDHISGNGRTIVKCCKVKNGHVINGDVAKVPWGVTVPEIVEAILELFSDRMLSEE